MPVYEQEDQNNSDYSANKDDILQRHLNNIIIEKTQEIKMTKREQKERISDLKNLFRSQKAMQGIQLPRLEAGASYDSSLDE